MPWPEDDPIFKAELNNKVVYGGDESSPSGNLLFLLVKIVLLEGRVWSYAAGPLYRFQNVGWCYHIKPKKYIQN